MMEEGFNAILLLSIFISTLPTIMLIKSILSRRRLHRRLPPGPPALPIIGHLHHLLGSSPHRAFHALAVRYGPLIHVRLGSTLCVLASSPEAARELLRGHDQAVAYRPESTATRRFAYGTAGFAFAPYGAYWKFMHKLCMSDLLSGRTVHRLLPVRRRELHHLLQSLLKASKAGEEVDLSRALIEMVNSVITRMTARAAPSVEALKLVKEVAELAGAFNLSDHIRLLRRLDVQGLNKRIVDVHRKFDAMLERIIVAKEESRRRRRSSSMVERGGAGEEEEVKDILDILLDVSEANNSTAEIKLTRDNIKGFILDVVTAGSDASAATVEWALAELINHPAVLAKAREEIDAVLAMAGGDTTRLVEEDDMPKLHYLQAVVKETLRLHPAAPLITREVNKDIHVGAAGSYIPKKTMVLVNVWSIGRDPAYWPEPMEFRPERFLGDATAAADKNSTVVVDVRGQHFHYLPFGTGIRGCPGVSLALQVVQVTLAAMIQCFEFKVAGGGGAVDMTDSAGMVSPRAQPLVCVPVARRDPFPSLQA